MVGAGQLGRGGDATGARFEQAAEQQRQGGLAGAVGSAYGECLSGAYRQVGGSQPGRQAEPVGGEQQVAGVAVAVRGAMG